MECTRCQHDLGDTTAREAFICVEIAGDEYIYSYWRCTTCGFYTLETYRDRFMGSPIVTVDAPIDPEEGRPTVDFIRHCPEPNNKRCRCDVHKKLDPHSKYTPLPADSTQGDKPDEEKASNQMAQGLEPRPVLLECPRCSAVTHSLKRYKGMRYVLYLGVIARVWRCTYTACPKCMRYLVLKNAFSLKGIVMANLMWLLVVLPYSLVLVLLSAIPGHSNGVLRAR